MLLLLLLLCDRKRIQKDNITFHPNNTVSYREYRRYFFEPSMSVGNESDIVTIPNMLVLVRAKPSSSSSSSGSHTKNKLSATVALLGKGHSK